MEMFTSFKKVMADPEITTAGKSVFLNLLSRMDKKGYCYPAVNTMEDETGYCERTIQRQTNKLAEKGYIVKADKKRWETIYKSILFNSRGQKRFSFQ